MVTLYKRATPAQARILRIVEGAVKNAADAHPELKISPHYRRSIAKRAAGTLTAQWPDVLAAKRSLSESGDARTPMQPRRRQQPAKDTMTAGRGAFRFFKRSPLGRVESTLRFRMKGIKANEHPEYARATIDALRLISEIRAGSYRFDDGGSWAATPGNSGTNK
jgi:hypothetical protein